MLIDLSKQNAVFIRTTNGHVVFIAGDKSDELVDRAFEMARIAAGVPLDPDQNSPQSMDGVSVFAIGLDAVQKMFESICQPDN